VGLLVIGQYPRSTIERSITTGFEMLRHPAICGILLAAAVVITAPARSETAEEFFRGKQIQLVIGYNPGGPYDVYSRLAATLLPKYVPGSPRIVPQNMPGVGSAKAANFLYSQAPRDGLTLGVIGQQLSVSQALGDASVKFDMRQFHWLGRFTSGAEATVIWHTSPVKLLADATKRETTLASTSASSSADAFPLLMNRIANTKFKMIRGYPGVTGTVLAMERGETEGAHATLEQILFGHQDWIKDKKAAVLVQYTQTRHPSFPDVPAMVEFGKTDLDRQVLALYGSTAEIGRAMMAPPGIPADRLAVLRRAFETMLNDPSFRQEVESRNLEFGPMPGAELQRLIVNALSISPEVMAHAIAMSRE
jgi:tripartite-type tricarboxylate transporter receptor subunit TctC